VVLHNFYVPAGGDIPDAALNPKFDHKLKFLDEMRDCAPLHPQGDARHILVGDLNVAPHEHDVWSHRQMLKIVSHTPVETEKRSRARPRLVRRRARAQPAVCKVYTWWSYRAPMGGGFAAAARPHLGVRGAARRVRDFGILRAAPAGRRPTTPVTAVLEA